jgi:pimeloyl-ACP methyl ester carboxylesterase
MINAKVKNNIKPLHINGMDGRVLRLPSPPSKKREMLVLYGHHASIERLSGLAEAVNEYGSVTMPDLPGFGGMSSFYKIGEKPTIDNYADYLASIIKLYFKRKKVTIVAMSFSVPLVVRTLQKYPELASKVELFVSIAGFVRRDEFLFSKPMYWGIRSLAYVIEKPIPAFLASKLLLNSFVTKNTYRIVSARHSKMKDAGSRAEREKRINFEANLWKINDTRTRMYTLTLMFTIDVCNERVPTVPVVHVSAGEDRYFDGNVVAEHLRVIFDDVYLTQSETPSHAPSIVADAEEAKMFIPKDLQARLNSD